MAEVKVFGIAFHSPLLIFNLIPPEKFHPILLVSENRKEIREQINGRMSENTDGKTFIVLAGSLVILQQFLEEYNFKSGLKILLFDFPGLILPFNNSMIRWLDCDYQNGGAWQVTKLMPEDFAETLLFLDDFDEPSRKVIMDMKRFVPQNRKAELEQIADSLSKSYKEFIVKEAENQKTEEQNVLSIKTDNWKKLTLTDMMKYVIKDLDIKLHAEFIELVLGYQVCIYTKREYNKKATALSRGNEQQKKSLAILRKWMDNNTLGEKLYHAYCDFLANAERRSWKTILEDNTVDESDLCLLLAYQSRDTVLNNKEIYHHYKDDFKSVKDKKSDGVPPTEPFYEFPTPLSTIFNLEEGARDES